MTKPTQGQLQQFLNLPQSQRPGRGSDLAKIGTGALAGALGAERHAEAARSTETGRPGKTLTTAGEGRTSRPTWRSGQTVHSPGKAA